MSNKAIKIGNISIGPDFSPFIVAELSGNHHHSLERALELVTMAKQVGAQAVKLQTYTPDTITLDVKEGEFVITDPKSLWAGKNLYELYQEAYTPWEWHEPIFARCRELGLAYFSTPFDESAVDFLETLNVPCYKIASPEIVDLPLIRKVAASKKPLMMSTGAATLVEIAQAVECARSAGCSELILLKCTSSYPAKPEDAHLRTLPHLSQTFDTLVGLSDHTLGIGTAIASVALGGCLIEKHLTLSRKEGGVDDAFSTEPHEFEAMVKESINAWKALGRVNYIPLEAEKVTHSHRPSLYFVQDLQAGEVLRPEHVRSVRPGKGLAPQEIDHILGLKLQFAVKKGTAVDWNFFKVLHP